MSHPFLGKRSSFSGFSGGMDHKQPDYYRDEEEQLDSHMQPNNAGINVQSNVQNNVQNNAQSNSQSSSNHLSYHNTSSVFSGPPSSVPGGVTVGGPPNNINSMFGGGYQHHPNQSHSGSHSGSHLGGHPGNPNQSQFMAYDQLPRRAAYFQSHWQLYAVDWADYKLALGTFSEDQSNKLQILHSVQDDKGILNFTHASDAAIAYPTTKIRWEPRFSGGNSTRLVSAGDCLRLWDYSNETNKLQARSKLVNKSKSTFLPPLTSLDWNKTNPSLVVTSSIDTTCTIWNIDTSSAVTQLIAHDSEVYDVAFVANSVDIFASVGADGSVRVFDLRSLDHSTIIYEPANPEPLLRIATNPHDKHMMATIAQNSKTVSVLDIRSPGVPLAVLDGHYKPVNSIAWAPTTAARVQDQKGSVLPSSTRHLLASGSDDYNVNIWNLSGAVVSGGVSKDNNASVGANAGASANASVGANAGASANASVGTNNSGNSTDSYVPIYTYSDSSEVNNISWSPDGTWMAVVSGRGLQGVKLS